MSLFKKPSKKALKQKNFGDEVEQDEHIAEPEAATSEPIVTKQKKTLLSFGDEEDDNDDDVVAERKSLAKKIKKKKRKKIVHEDEELSMAGIGDVPGEFDSGARFGARVSHKFDYDWKEGMAQRSIIPDAATIHAARKCRQKARQMSYLGFSPEHEFTQKENLVEIEVDEDDVIEMKLNNGPENKIDEDTIFMPDDLNDWEDQQIRKGVSSMKMDFTLVQPRPKLQNEVSCDEVEEVVEMEEDVEFDLEAELDKLQVNFMERLEELEKLMSFDLKEQAEQCLAIEELKTGLYESGEKYETAQRIDMVLSEFFANIPEISAKVTAIDNRFLEMCVNRSNLVIERRRKFFENQSIAVRKSIEVDPVFGLTDKEEQDFDEEFQRLVAKLQNLKKKLEGNTSLKGNSLTIRSVLNMFKSLRESKVAFFDDAYDFNEMVPVAIEPFIRIEYLLKNPLDEAFFIDFDAQWVALLMMFSPTENYLLSKVVEDTVLSIITPFVQFVWDPMEKKQSQNLSMALKTFIIDYPTITHESAKMRNLADVVVDRINDSLERDIYLPLLSKESVSDREVAFFESQFEVALSFLESLMLWSNILNDNILIQLTVTNLINKRLLSSLRISYRINRRAKMEAILRILPKSWLSANLMQMNAIRQFLESLK